MADVNTLETNITYPYVPEYITVHLGRPNDSAQNVTVSFPDYIKNVASSELYPTWPENALKANIYCQVSVALNRVYTEWYRSMGYNFDITNSTAYDQSFVYGRDIFENINILVDEQFNDYLVKYGRLEPFFAQYCDGRRVQCDGLSQWGSVDLAKQGYTPYEILQYYFGDDIQIVTDAPIQGIRQSYPGTPLRNGSTGPDVRTIQILLNRISVNYPNIPKIYPVDGIFNDITESAVRKFQGIFNLTQDGIVGKGTWYRLIYIYVAVKNLAELTSEGIVLGDVPKQYPGALQEGDEIPGVRLLQYFLDVISSYYSTIPRVTIDGYYGPETTNAVRAYQQDRGLPQTGAVDEVTWNSLYATVLDIFSVIPPESVYFPAMRYPGVILRIGSERPEVLILQEYLAFIATLDPDVPSITPDGRFGNQTQAAVEAFQREYGLDPDGIVGELTWNMILEVYLDLRYGQLRSIGQYPGIELREGNSDRIGGGVQ